MFSAIRRAIRWTVNPKADSVNEMSDSSSSTSDDEEKRSKGKKNKPGTASAHTSEDPPRPQKLRYKGKQLSEVVD